MILAIETSGAVCGVALHDGERVVAIREDDRPRIHDAVLSDQIRSVLADAGVALADVSAVACSIGPGSFTGIRIGLSAAKGLCFGLGIPLVPVPTLDALAHAARGAAAASGAKVVLAAIAAERDKSYVCEFAPNGARTGEYRTLQRAALPPVDATFLVIGTASLYFSSWESVSGQEITLPRVQYIAELGAALFARGVFDDPAGVEPLYVTTVVHATS